MLRSMTGHGREQNMYSEQTENLGLPQWQPKDHPDFLTDVNEAFEKLDTAISTIEGASPEVVEALGERVTESEKRLDDLAVAVSENSDEIKATATIVELHTTQIAGLNSDVGTLQDDVTGVKESVEKLAEEDSSLRLQIDALHKELDDKGDVSTAELDAVKETVSGHTTQIANNTEQIEELQAAVDNIQTADGDYVTMETYQERKSIVDQNIQNLNTFAKEQETRNSTYESSMKNLESADAELKTAINDCETTNTNQDAAIQALEAQLEEFEALKTEGYVMVGRTDLLTVSVENITYSAGTLLQFKFTYDMDDYTSKYGEGEFAFGGIAQAYNTNNTFRCVTSVPPTVVPYSGGERTINIILLTSVTDYTGTISIGREHVFKKIPVVSSSADTGTDTSALEEKIGELADNINTLNTELTNTNTTLTALTNDVTALQNAEESGYRFVARKFTSDELTNTSSIPATGLTVTLTPTRASLGISNDEAGILCGAASVSFMDGAPCLTLMDYVTFNKSSSTSSTITLYVHLYPFSGTELTINSSRAYTISYGYDKFVRQ